MAVLGGDGRYRHTGPADDCVRIFQAQRYGGNGELRRLEAALRAGGVDRLVVLARWNGHSATKRVLKICRQLGVPVEVVP